MLTLADPAQRKKERVRKLMAEDIVELWALEQVHFQQQGSRYRMWVSKETKNPVVYHTTS